MKPLLYKSMSQDLHLAYKEFGVGILTFTVGEAGVNESGVGNVILGSVGGVTVNELIVTCAGSTCGAAGAVTLILGALKIIVSGCAGVAGVLSAIVIAPFTTCFGLIATLTLNPTVGSKRGFTPTSPYESETSPVLCELEAAFFLEARGISSYLSLKGFIALSYLSPLSKIPS